MDHLLMYYLLKNVPLLTTKITKVKRTKNLNPSYYHSCQFAPLAQSFRTTVPKLLCSMKNTI